VLFEVHGKTSWAINKIIKVVDVGELLSTQTNMNGVWDKKFWTTLSSDILNQLKQSFSRDAMNERLLHKTA
jgi:hypothetical protein